MEQEQETLLEFPCRFSVKAMGLASEEFDCHVVNIILRHVKGLEEGAVKTKHSSKGKYISITVTFEATSKSQLDAIYQDLSDDQLVLMSL